MTEVLSPNTKAILLLTAPLITGRGGESADLLAPREYKKLDKHLIGLGAKPADLLTPAADPLLGDCDRAIDKARLERLLGRGFLLSQAIERWHSRAIWVVSWADDTYPQRLKTRLRGDSPAILYGCGDKKILDDGGLAVVGSRYAADALIKYAQHMGRLAALAGRTLVSGGARGIDQAALSGALEAGGKATGVLADSLERAVMQRENRNMLLDEKLVLISPYDPSAGFDVGHAMQRNKLIYALADAALVVSADLKKGGTWAGAIEQLEGLHLVPVFVRKAYESSPGLEALEKKGALPWPEPVDAACMNATLATPVPERAPPPKQIQLPDTSTSDTADQVRDAAPLASQPAAIVPTAADQSALSEADELFVTVRSLVRRLVRRPMSAAEIALGLGVTAPQVQKWLSLLVKEGALKKSKPPVRFFAPPISLFEGERAAADQPALSETEELFMTVRSLVARLVRKPMKAAEVARGLGVNATQAQGWLSLLVKEGMLEKSKRPVVYIARQSTVFEGEVADNSIAKTKPAGSGK